MFSEYQHPRDVWVPVKGKVLQRCDVLRHCNGEIRSILDSLVDDFDEGQLLITDDDQCLCTKKFYLT
jgi:hypothetical protein